MSEHQGSLREAMLSGSFWMVATRWGMRFIGIISMAILARLLLPSDFGLMAMAMLVVGFAEAWFAFGVDLALIRDKNAARPEFDTAWSLRLVQTTVVAVIVAITAPWCADIFDDARLPPVMYAVAVGVLFTGLTNIGVVAFRRDLRFKQEFVLLIAPKLVSFFATIGVAWVLENYWALVIGTLISQIGSVVASYVMHPYRPRFSFAEFGKLWSFSQWMLITNLAWYLEQRSDEAVVGAVGATADLGHYTVASEISLLPSTELSSPLMRALYPVISKMQDEPQRVRAAFSKVLGTLAGLTFPAGVGMALLAPQIVPIVLGEGWGEAVPFLQVLGLFGVIRASYGPAGSTLVALNKVRQVAMITWSHALLFLALSFLMIQEMGLVGVAWAKLISSVYAGIANYWYLVVVTQITWRDVLGAFWRPALSTAVMAIALLAVTLVVPASFGLLATLTLLLLTGLVSYAVVTSLVWWLSGCPDGLEYLIFEKLGLMRRFHESP